MSEDLRPSRRRQPDGRGVTVSQRLVNALRERILSGDMEPGSRIVIDSLCDRYNVSHIPVREALRILEGEGLLTHVPNHGTHVANLSATEIDSLYDVRILLEPPLILRSCRVKTPADVRAAQRALDLMAGLDPVSDPVDFQNAHRDFHASLIVPAATPVTRKILEPIWQHVQRYLILMYHLPEIPPLGGAQHEEILAAWRDGEDACAGLLQDHLENGRQQIAAAIANSSVMVATAGD